MLSYKVSVNLSACPCLLLDPLVICGEWRSYADRLQADSPEPGRHIACGAAGSAAHQD